ncbi:bifunctional apoptosis regulator isoform X1 [Prionailurus iriomotensis]|uniref:bifunctional apoptosis regulator isoform X1 n=1 Tax=Prionailurus bengalensis TaxID=37029 RepID=UPI001CA7CAE0|nr:bifunctional apoptosis regulator isoform X1 [Prionailurus bengalensis]XP_043416420.1 bifunctional apoptosis regulator isoform X1 [Prionailurus bengalensis]XP_043416422.1 bifunctional apoptosis regulator isoform X1 [Prionailurus bengalensis]XP_043416423.1 bifunctional apoptosis regulator isoform X1 [Prionailurus bengalensis]XP_043416424.1 bifunctional apoptosis regulator isoform X1 [Prionailurus bengalensis]
MEGPAQNDLNKMTDEEGDPLKSTTPQISVSEFSCHCCYDILVNPTTLNCGHSFCRHCLALWWASSKKTECPECREKWEGFPKVNILLRDAIEKLFPDAIRMRFEDIQQNNDIIQSLAAFHKYGNDQAPLATNTGRVNAQRGGGFFSGVLTALTGVAVVLLVYHWSSRESEHDLLVHKAVAKWTAEEVVLWLEQLGPWASLYRDRFLSERVNGRLLVTLTEEEFSRAPYNIENSSHRRAILLELERVKALGVKPPQNLWEYKAVNPGRSLFLLYALKSSPRLGLLYLYLFDYTDTFLPFIHTICPLQEDNSGEDIITKLLDLREPTWKQWREFLVKYSFLPYQLIAEFAWDWLEVHYWTSRFLIVNAMLLSVLELFSFWRIWSRSELKTVPQRMWSHFWKVSTQGLFVAMFWPLIPQFVCNCLFYWALYFNPIINIDLVVKEVRRLETQVL